MDCAIRRKDVFGSMTNDEAQGRNPTLCPGQETTIHSCPPKNSLPSKAPPVYSCLSCDEDSTAARCAGRIACETPRCVLLQAVQASSYLPSCSHRNCRFSGKSGNMPGFQRATGNFGHALHPRSIRASRSKRHSERSLGLSVNTRLICVHNLAASYETGPYANAERAISASNRRRANRGTAGSSQSIPDEPCDLDQADYSCADTRWSMHLPASN